MTNQKKAYLYALTAVMFWSTAATAFKLTLRHIDILQLLLISSLTSFAVLLAVVIVQGKFGLLVATGKHDLMRSLIVGMLNPVLYYVVLFKAYSLLPAQQAMTLNYTWPLMLVILSIPLLKQKISLHSISAIAVSFTGVIIIATGRDTGTLHITSPLGVGLALGSSVIWALFWICNVRDHRDEVVKLCINFAFGTVAILMITGLFSTFSLPSIAGAVGAVYIGLFEMGITFVLWLMALKHSRTTAQVGNLVYLSPFLSLVFISIVIGEQIELTTIAGLVMILAGIIFQKRSKQDFI
ncbi:DMT family transporter [Candidatus Latescibacterota bacterium]